MTEHTTDSHRPLAADRPQTVAGLLLAAGGGRRLGGRPKALLDYGGRPLVEHAARVLRTGGCGPVQVVLGAAAAEVGERARLEGYQVVVNPGWKEGMGSSLRAGLEVLAGTGARAVVVALVDQPGIGADAVAGSLAAASYDGKRGHPVLFGRDRWAEIAAGAVGDQGARSYLGLHQEELLLVECADIAVAADIDTPEDLRLLRESGATDSAQR